MLDTAIKPDEMRMVREGWGLNQGEMGRLMGVTHAAVSGWEKGKQACRGPAAILFRILADDRDVAYHQAKDAVTGARMQVLQRRLRLA